MIDRIDQDLKSAMLSGDKRKIATLRMLKSALTNARIALKGELDEATSIATLQKEAKQRTEAAESFEKAGRLEQAAEERAEYEIIASYLPAQLSEAELNDLISHAIKETGAKATEDMGKVMAWLKPQISGKADGGKVAGLVRENLAN